SVVQSDILRLQIEHRRWSVTHAIQSEHSEGALHHEDFKRRAGLSVDGNLQLSCSCWSGGGQNRGDLGWGDIVENRACGGSAHSDADRGSVQESGQRNTLQRACSSREVGTKNVEDGSL